VWWSSLVEGIDVGKELIGRRDVPHFRFGAVAILNRVIGAETGRG
jgi:hypothetical protein